jgi:hypothetical protein
MMPHFAKGFGLLKRAAKPENNRDNQATNQKRDSPTPRRHIARGNQRRYSYTKQRSENDSQLLTCRLL